MKRTENKNKRKISTVEQQDGGDEDKDAVSFPDKLNPQIFIQPISQH